MYIVLYVCVCLSLPFSLFAPKRSVDEVNGSHLETLAEPSPKKPSRPSECLQEELTAQGPSYEKTQDHGPSFIEMLPSEILDKIIDLAIADSTDVKNITSTCKRFQDIVHARALPYQGFLDIHLDGVSKDSFIPLARWQIVWNKSSQGIMTKISQLSSILEGNKSQLEWLNLFYSEDISYYDEGVLELLLSIDKVLMMLLAF